LLIAEDAYLICRQLGAVAEASLFRSIKAGELRIVDVTLADWTRVRELVTTYSSLPLGGTDASVVAIAERLGAPRIATLDRRRFTVIRPRHVEAFELLP
jgi:predicted nucleic acid-binding protein